MDKKMTKLDAFKGILAILEDDADYAEYAEFCKHEIELIENRSASKKDSPKAKESAEIEKIVLYVLSGLAEDAEGMTVGEILKADEYFKEHEITSQKLTPVMTRLYKSGQVDRVSDKKTNRYKLMEGGEQ